MSSIPHLKRCTKCGVDKPTSDYYPDKRYADGWYPWCAECRRAYRKKHYNTPEKIRAERDRTRDFYRNNDEARERNRAAGRIWDRHMWHTDPAHRARKNEQAAIKNSKRRKYAAERGSFTYREWRALCVQCGFCCLKCGKHARRLSPDHIKPLSRGGSNTIDNIQPLCFHCNMQKGAKHIDYRSVVQQRMEWDE